MAYSTIKILASQTIVINHHKKYDKDENGDIVIADKEQDLVHATGWVHDITVFSENKKGKIQKTTLSRHAIMKIVEEINAIEAIKSIEKFEF